MKALIMHVDMDAFFAAVEELANPALKGKALAVAGPGERTIVTTASYKARAFGVRTGMTVPQAKNLCRDLIVLKADYRKYAHASGLVMRTLESFTPMINVLSIDEAFLDISDLTAGFGEPRDLGRKSKQEVLSKTGLTCSVGIATGRLLAKLASTLEKPDGLTVIREEDACSILKGLPVGRLCGIGPATAEKLGQMGIRTCGELGSYPLEPLERRFGKLGKDLSRMGRGLDPAGNPILGGRTEKSLSISHSVTFPRDLTGKESMKQVLLTLSEMVGRRIRRHNGTAGRISVTWRLGDFSTFTRQKTLNAQVFLTKDIYHHSLSIFEGIELTGPVRLLGITLSGLCFEGSGSFLLEEDLKRNRLQETLDSVNDRYGEFSLAFGGTIGDLRSQKVISPSWRAKGIRNSY